MYKTYLIFILGEKNMYNKMYRLVNIINTYLSDMFLLQIVIIIIITEPGEERP